MHAFDVLGDPVRRRIMELLDEHEAAGNDGVAAGTICARMTAEFGITQPAVSRHLRVLRENGFARASVHGQQRLYSIDSPGLATAEAWLSRYRRFWTQRLDALDTELRRGATKTKQPGPPRSQQ
ncbi:MAG: transcriptional regulator, ArsR family [Ilumatobacteraceae bacterium]|nr:transcriptional regulator, ArsR family [Ilumatobacteraceae bacterium]